MEVHESVVIAVMFLSVLLVILAFIRDIKTQKREKKLLLSQLDENTENDMNAEAASVVSRRTADEWTGGTNNLRYNMRMYVTFMKFDGSVAEYSVSEEMYKKCIPGVSGMLVTINGLFFDFGDGERIK